MPSPRCSEVSSSVVVTTPSVMAERRLKRRKYQKEWIAAKRASIRTEKNADEL